MSTNVPAQGVQPSRKRTADDRNAFEVPFKQARSSECAGEAFVAADNDNRHYQYTANPATDHSAFQQQQRDGVRLSLDSGVHELSASSDRQNLSSDNGGFPPLAGVNYDGAARSNHTHEAARLSLDSGAQDLSGSSEHRNASSIAANVQPFDDVSDQAASEGNAAQLADFTTFASPCPIVPKRDGPYKVYSRLQTMNNVKRYDVSVDELRRRASLPEGFNAAVLNSYLRRPKAAENVRELRSELSANGLAVPNGRRHHKNLTAFSCLVEQEASDLANDYDDLSKTFPYRPVGQKLARSLQGPHQLASVQAAIQLIEGSLLAISDAAKSEPQDQPVKHIAKGAPKEGDLEDFSLLTHGFGLAAHRTAWTTLLQTLKAAASTLQQQMSSRMPPMMSMPSFLQPSTSGFAPAPWSMPPMSPFYPFMGFMPRGNR